MDCLEDNGKVSSVKIRGKILKYSQMGEGPLVVLLPPPLADYRIYCRFQLKLSKYFKVVSIDLPEVDNLDDAIQILIDFIKVGTIHSFYLLASSATGWIAQYLTEEFSDRVLGLVLLNSFYHNDKYGKKYNLALKSTKLLPGFKFRKEVLKKSAYLLQEINNSQHVRNYLVNRIQKLDKSGVRNQMSWFVSEKSPPKELSVPILHIYNNKDPVLSNVEKKEIAEKHQNVTSKQIDTKAHLLALSHQKEISNYLIEFSNIHKKND